MRSPRRSGRRSSRTSSVSPGPAAVRPGSASSSSERIPPRRSTFATRSRPAARPACGWICSACRRRRASTISLALVERLNASDVHDGILVQSPLPDAMGKHAAQRVFDAIDPAKDVDGFQPEQCRASRPGPPPSGAVHAVRRDRHARSLRHCHSEDPRRHHRAQRDRRQAHGVAAAAAGRHGNDLSFEDARTCRQLRARPTFSSPRSVAPGSSRRLS